jgi:glycosyltransferase involved in cell wall biosynthesis/putative flippase GtrA
LPTLARHSRRIPLFMAIGAFVFAVGNLVLILCVEYLHLRPGWAYLPQALVSVELSYLLNWKFTWRAEDARFWRSFARFNLSRCVTVPANQLAFVLLLSTGLHYVLAIVVTTAIFTAVNYAVAHVWAFRNSRHTTAPFHSPADPQPRWSQLAALPSVSVVIPVKRSQATIRACVQSLLAQDYAGDLEIIAVGDVEDPTWSAIADLIDDGRVRALECTVRGNGRDANAKRNVGLAAAAGDVIALTDSDMQLPAGWVSRGVSLLGRGYAGAAGPMTSTVGTFWSRYIDLNPLLPRTPRMGRGYVLTASSFGRRGFKPPVTANVFLRRDVIEHAGMLNQNFVNSYEDYEYFARVCANGYDILCTPELVATHTHRDSFGELLRDYRRAGRGCADFVREHPHSALSLVRKGQLAALVTVSSLALAAAALSLAFVTIVPPGLAVVAACYLTAAVYCVARTGLVAALANPAVTVVLLATFAVGMVDGLRAVPAGSREVHVLVPD